MSAASPALSPRIGEPVHDRSASGGSVKVWFHSLNRSVAGAGDRGAFLALGDDLEQKLSSARVQMDVSQLVKQEQVEPG